MPASVGRSIEYSPFRWALEEILPLNLVRAWSNSWISRNQGVELILGYNQLVFSDIPWIVHAEVAHALVGRGFSQFERYKRIAQRLLVSERCKGILAWTEFAKKSLYINFSAPDDFAHKLVLVPQAVPKKKPGSFHEREGINILFVGSVNSPDTFVSKGGLEALQAFLLLDKVYDNLTLTIRANVPDWVAQLYQLRKHPRVTLLERAMLGAELDALFRNADIFLYPTRQVQNFVVVDAMSYGLPVLTTEAGSSGRLENNVDGIVLEETPPRFGFLELRRLGYHLPFDMVSIKQIIEDSKSLDRTVVRRAVREHEGALVKEIVQKASRLIDHSNLRVQIGNRARMVTDDGKLSVKERNRILQSIFDRAIGDDCASGRGD